MANQKRFYTVTHEDGSVICEDIPIDDVSKLLNVSVSQLRKMADSCRKTAKYYYVTSSEEDEPLTKESKVVKTWDREMYKVRKRNHLDTSHWDKFLKANPDRAVI